MRPLVNHIFEALSNEEGEALYYTFKFVAYDKNRRLWLGVKIEADDHTFIVDDEDPNSLVQAFWFDENGVAENDCITFTLECTIE